MLFLLGSGLEFIFHCIAQSLLLIRPFFKVSVDTGVHWLPKLGSQSYTLPKFLTHYCLITWSYYPFILSLDIQFCHFSTLQLFLTFMKYLNNHLMKSPTFPAHQRGLQKKLTKIFIMVVKLIRTSYRGY